MYPFGGIIIAPLVAGYLASLICRWQKSRGKQPGIGAYGVSITVAVVAVWVITFGDELLKKDNGNVQRWVLLVISGIPAFVVGSIAAFWIVDRYRRE